MKNKIIGFVMAFALALAVLVGNTSATPALAHGGTNSGEGIWVSAEEAFNSIPFRWTDRITGNSYSDRIAGGEHVHDTTGFTDIEHFYLGPCYEARITIASYDVNGNHQWTTKVHIFGERTVDILPNTHYFFNDIDGWAGTAC